MTRTAVRSKNNGQFERFHVRQNDCQNAETSSATTAKSAPAAQPHSRRRSFSRDSHRSACLGGTPGTSRTTYNRERPGLRRKTFKSVAFRRTQTRAPLPETLTLACRLIDVNCIRTLSFLDCPKCQAPRRRWGFVQADIDSPMSIQVCARSACLRVLLRQKQTQRREAHVLSVCANLRLDLDDVPFHIAEGRRVDRIEESISVLDLTFHTMERLAIDRS